VGLDLVVAQQPVELLDAVLVALAAPASGCATDRGDARVGRVQRADDRMCHRLRLLHMQMLADHLHHHAFNDSGRNGALSHAP
jgi:hypothetical protein